MTILTNRFDDAFRYASHIHGGHRRKGTRIPYISHLMSVSALTLEHGGNEDQAIAALLHDAAEDCGGKERLDDIRNRFGDDVADIVDDCTDSWEEPKPAWRTRKEDYIGSLSDKHEDSLLVSAADKTHNARAIVSDLRSIGHKLWDRFNADRSGVLWYYQGLADAFRTRVPAALAWELQRNVDEMRSFDEE